MLRAGLGISTALDPGAAAKVAVRQSLERLGDVTPAVALVLASTAHGHLLPTIAQRALRELDGVPMMGGSVEGIIAPDVEVSSYPAVLVLTIAGVDALPFLFRDVGGEETRVGEDLAARIGGQLSGDDIVVVLPDSLGLHGGRLAAGLAEHLGPATILGTGAAATPRGPAFLWNGTEVANDGVSGMLMRGARPRLCIAQAGCCVTPPLTVSRARGNWVMGLEGRPALDTYLETVRRRGGVPSEEVNGATPTLLVGLLGKEGASRDGADAPRVGNLLVRNIVGFDRERGGFSVPEPMRSGDRLVLVELDADAARDAFAAELEDLRDPRPAFGLFFNCRARGASLFGEPGVEATCLANAFADCPIAGVIGPYQLAPPELGADPQVLTYAGALALMNDP